MSRNTRKPRSAAGETPASSELTGWLDPAARMHAALERDELELFAQSIAALAPGERTSMAEVLVRLREEEEKLLPPGDFLPVFEHFGMMPELDRWVVRHALSHLARRSKRKYTCLSVNLSAQTLEDPDFAPFVAAELVRSRVDPNALCFEIDEVDTLTKTEQAAQFSEAARRIGCKVLIDGFGLRSVTFQALVKLKPQFVKVDGIIVRRILTNPEALNKLTVIQRFCRINGAALIAECVEDGQVLARLIEIGVGMAQGFGIAIPRPIER